MNGLGELFLYLIYAFLIVMSLGFLVLVFVVNKKNRTLPIVFCAISILLLFWFKSCNDQGDKLQQLRQVGTYYLTQYPDCPDCDLVLEKSQQYKIIKEGKIIGTGDWHFEWGQDYFITYLNGNSDQLGSGKYAYKVYNLKYTEETLPN
jgi:hypothetical protein